MCNDLRNILESEHIEASAPCRMDMGGTLDISTFHYPLRHFSPCTFNIALDLRTRVCLSAYNKDMVKVSSKGFKSVEYPLNRVPFDHPLGLMFAIVAYFGVEGVHIQIKSSSPPRSALGGSSSAAVALIAAFSRAFEKNGAGKILSRKDTAMLAYAIEGSVAGVPCGLQDQLAAVYGGVNAWYWLDGIKGSRFKKKAVYQKKFFKNFEKHLLLAYCGVPHISKDINGKWVKQFVSGRYRELWVEIIACTRRFVDALNKHDFKYAAESMNGEMALRKKMTPEVLDPMGEELVNSAVENNCGARFTGAGGGGCIWAIGENEDITRLKREWESILSEKEKSRMLDVNIDSQGLIVTAS
ncbi:MAG: galactokinase [Proteobacteria bacterium]|nr:galactokinase [Pseudomonadota bacterium]MBU4287496.1 galactokinase [Pseudomonadota bacterium]MBU4414926.1 galactokinase [Pseudomonadota bacterium]MCG2758501.1 galactokinase [Desulfobacteraceae bacterium]